MFTFRVSVTSVEVNRYPYYLYYRQMQLNDFFLTFLIELRRMTVVSNYLMETFLAFLICLVAT